METAQEALRKIPIALQNLGLSVEKHRLVANYIHNLLLVVLQDKDLRQRLEENQQKTIEELAKL